MIRDKLNIFQKIKEDLIETYGVRGVAAVGSRVTDRVGGKNDFDVLSHLPTLNELRNAPSMSPDRWIFCQKLLQGEAVANPAEFIFNTYLHRTLPHLKKKWLSWTDEYGNPVKVDIGWTGGTFPEHAVVL